MCRIGTMKKRQSGITRKVIFSSVILKAKLTHQRDVSFEYFHIAVEKFNFHHVGENIGL